MAVQRIGSGVEGSGALILDVNLTIVGWVSRSARDESAASVERATPLQWPNLIGPSSNEIVAPSDTRHPS